MKTDYVYADTEWSIDDPKEVVVRHIKPKTRVLDVGCGVGAFGGWLKKNHKCSVDGIEFHPDAVKESKKRLDRVSLVDLNNITKLNSALQGKSFHYITLIDVLEHCMYPVEVLQSLKKHMVKRGAFLISLPNVAHHSVRFGLLKGQFNYADSGILDRTHVKFYTKKTMQELVEKAGLRSEVVGATVPHSGVWKYVGKVDPTIAAVQFVIKAS